MRISWWSNAPWCPTGYGTQTAQVVRRLAAEGHEVAVSANYGLQGQMLEWEGVPIYPTGMDAMSQDTIVADWWDWHRRGNGDPTLLVTLFDVWVLKNERLDDVPVIGSWVPIDHLPTPVKVREWCQRSNVLPIAMSQFGASMLDRGGIDNVYVPHAIEPDFRPTEAMPSGVSCRDLIDVDESAFLVMINANNKGTSPIRKAFGEMFLAFASFVIDHPDSVLYVHSTTDPGQSGVNLPRLAGACGIPEQNVRYVDQYAYRHGLDNAELAAFYTAADVLLSTSLGEGFGIPVIEAQACGTRVIVSDWTAQSELVGDGWRVQTQPTWDEHQHAWWGTPKVEQIVSSLEAAYRAERGTSDKAVGFAEQYGADVVFDAYWRPALERFGNELAGS